MAPVAAATVSLTLGDSIALWHPLAKCFYASLFTLVNTQDIVYLKYSPVDADCEKGVGEGREGSPGSCSMVDIMGTGSETSTAGGSPPAHSSPGDCMSLVEQVQWLSMSLLFTTHLTLFSGSEAVSRMGTCCISTCPAESLPRDCCMFSCTELTILWFKANVLFACYYSISTKPCI